VGSRSVTCKGHAESGITCRGKAPRIAKASHASRRGEWKRSWQPSPCAHSARNRRARTKRGKRQGCQSWSRFRSLGPGWDVAESGRKLPRAPGDPRSDSGVVKTLDSPVLAAARCQGYTQGASPDDEPEADEYGCSLKQSVGWQKSVGRISITHRGKSQDEPTRRDLAKAKSSFRNTE
jgi:hypothetical protein